SKSRQPHNSKNQHHSSSRLRPRHLSQIRLLITVGAAPTSALTAAKIIIPATKTPAKMLTTLTLTTALITRPRTTTALPPPRVLPTERLRQAVALNPRHSALWGEQCRHPDLSSPDMKSANRDDDAQSPASP